VSEGSDRHRHRVRIAWAIVGLFSLFVLFLGSSRFNAAETGGVLAPLLELLFPDLDASQRYLLHRKVRKTAHVVEYAVLALLTLRAAFITFRTATIRIAAVAVALAFVVAATDEARQAFLPERTGSLGDLVLDTTGAATAVALALLIRWLSRRFRGASTESASP
jgi:VanZ family protein